MDELNASARRLVEEGCRDEETLWRELDRLYPHPLVTEDEMQAAIKHGFA